VSDEGELTGGIYVHYPFCVHRCPFCDFNLITPRKIPHGTYTDALLSELNARAPSMLGPAQTLYIGGGTPSLWALGDLGRFLDAVRDRPGLSEDAEITIEANPTEVSAPWLREILAMGINRVSLGVQALRDDLLRSLERTHDARAAMSSIDALLSSGLRSVSMDLLFGIEGQRPDIWEADLREVQSMGVPHLSVYGLTLEEGTPLWDRVRKGKVTLPSEEEQLEMLLSARRHLRESGYVHYEVSSYAQPGHRARHNSGYWTMRPYLGLGAGAHGFLPPVRYKNESRVRRYMSRSLEELPTMEEEALSPELLAFEEVMCGLRDLERGIELSRVHVSLQDAVQSEMDRGFIERVDQRLRLTDSGLLLMDDVLLRLTPDT